MSQRSSQQDQDAIVWQTIGLQLGLIGLDLRHSSDPRALAKLLNARFRDERTIERRLGYVGYRVSDAGGYPQHLDENDNNVSLPMVPNGWVYGHGQVVSQTSLTRETDHLPQPRRGQGTFTYDGSDVVWTGDRLLIMRENDPALGQSAYWNTENTALNYGIPAYIPVATDTLPPDTIDGKYVEACLTDKVQVVVKSGGDSVVAWVTSRENNVLINKTVLDTSPPPTELGEVTMEHLRVLKSGAFVVAIWMRSDGSLYTSHWTGLSWTAKSLVDSSVDAFDVCATAGGFYLVWRVAGDIYVGRYSGATVKSTPFSFQTAVTYTGSAANGPVAVAVAPDSTVTVVWSSADGIIMKSCNAALTTGTQGTIDATTGWVAISVMSRLLSHGQGQRSYSVVIHAECVIPAYSRVATWEFYQAGALVQSDTRYNTEMTSKSFRVGNEAFCWVRAANAGTNYLIAGARAIQVCGYADREVAEQRGSFNGIRATSSVSPDPIDDAQFVWARPYVTGQSYARGGNVIVGLLDFLPPMSTAQYGESVYVAGSAVRAWDGQQLGDCGFQNYPLVTNVTPGAAGSMTDGDYIVRVYPVRYNKRGERFQGAAIAYSFSLSGNTSATLDIATLPDTNHDDVIFEVWRTEAGGTTLYLEGTVANDLTVAAVSFECTLSDSGLRDNEADPHAPGVGAQAELTEFGPTGCSMVMAAGDRLWCAGGQVPIGRVEFSKLKEPNEGAGFADLTEYLTIDSEGGAITSMASYGDSRVFFQRDKLYALTGEGEDNYGVGSFSIPQLVLTDGAITHLGTINTQYGPVFWGVDGPRLLTTSRVEVISMPVRLLTKDMTPTGVQINLARQEVVWFTAEGDAVLWNYANGTSRWAQWKGLNVAACSNSALLTTDGRLLKESEDAQGDDGCPFEFAGSTSELRTEPLLGGATEVRTIGFVGEFNGPHELRYKVFHNGSPMWAERQRWRPATDTWLMSLEDFEDFTPAQVDALTTRDRSGAYATHKRVNRNGLRHFRIEWSDVGSTRPTYTLQEITLELGVRGGMGRVPVNSFRS